MCDKSIKTKIYELFEEGLSANEVIEKLNLYEYKNVVNGCYTYYNGQKKQGEKNLIEKELDKSDLDCERLKHAVINFSECGRELLNTLSSLNGVDFSKMVDTYTFLRQIIMHEMEDGNTQNLDLFQAVAKTRRNYKKIGEVVGKFDRNNRNNLNSLVVLTENLVKFYSYCNCDGTEAYIKNRINKKDSNVKGLVELIRELM